MNSSRRGTVDARMPRPTASSFSYFAAVSMCRISERDARLDRTFSLLASQRPCPQPDRGHLAPERSVTVGARVIGQLADSGVTLSAARIARS